MRALRWAALAAALFLSALPIAAHAQPTSWEYPTVASYAASASDNGKGLASDNLANGAASITVQLPCPATVGNGWSMSFREGSGRGIVVNADPGCSSGQGGYILAGQVTKTSLTLPSDTNYEFAELSSDGTDYQLTAISDASRLANGLTGSAGASNWTYLYTSGYSATPADNGHVLSSVDTGGATTVTLPSTPLLPTGWSVSLAQDGGNSITAQVNATNGGQILTADGRSLSSYAPGAGRALVWLQFDGANFRVVSDTSLGAPPNLLNFGARPDGTKDVAGALTAAIAAAQTQNPAMPVVTIPAGEYLLDGSGGTVNLSHVTLDCQGQPPDADAAPGNTAQAMGHQGATFWLTSTVVAPFTLGMGPRIEHCNAYWPNQTGVGSAIAVGASPFAWTNTTSQGAVVNISGGAVSNVTVGAISEAEQHGTYPVPPGQTITVIYSAAPTMTWWQPIIYPPLFANSPSGTGNVDLIDDRIINAYDFFDQTSPDAAMGNIHLDGTYGYTIRDWFGWSLVNEASTITGFAGDVNLFQASAFGAGHPDFPAYWTNAFGSTFYVTGDATTLAAGGVGGVIMTGSAVYGEGAFLNIINSGLVSESSFTGNIIDGTASQLIIGSGGCAVVLKMHNLDYTYYFSPAYAAGGAIFSAGDMSPSPTYEINTASTSGCTSDQIDLSGDVNKATGDVLDISGNAVKNISLHDSSLYYGETGASGTYFPVQTSSAATNLILRFIGDHIEPLAADQGSHRQGLYLNQVYAGTIDDNVFNGVWTPIASNSAGGRVTGRGNISVGSPSGSVALGGSDLTDLHALETGNQWDALAAPVCGANCASVTAGSSDARGAIQVASGTITSVTMNFGLSWSGNPVCTATDTAAPLYAPSVSTTGITWATPAGGNLGGSQIYYECR